MIVLYLFWIQTVTQYYRQMLKFSKANNVFTQTNTTLVITAVLRNFYKCFGKKRRNNFSNKRYIQSFKTLQLKSFTVGNQSENMEVTSMFICRWLSKQKTNLTLWGILQLQEKKRHRWKNKKSHIYMLSLWQAIVQNPWFYFICL